MLLITSFKTIVG